MQPRKGVLLGDSLGVQFPVAGKSWRQESGAAGHAASIEEARSEECWSQLILSFST